MRTKTDALIMAAGMGTRMLPLTKECAKPLVPVCGTTMIETVINALKHSGINNIYVVVGYKSEQFEFLTKKYNDIILVKNSEFECKNNISSLHAAAHLIGENDCFVCEADLFISDSSIFSDVNRSCYFGKFVNGHSEDWVFETANKIEACGKTNATNTDGIDEKAGKIIEIRKRGDSLYNMTGLSFFKKEDVRTLCSSVIDAYKQEGHESLFWDEVVNANLDKLSLYIKPVTGKQIIEIDTVAELEDFIKERECKA